MPDEQYDNISIEVDVDRYYEWETVDEETAKLAQKKGLLVVEGGVAAGESGKSVLNEVRTSGERATETVSVRFTPGAIERDLQESLDAGRITTREMLILAHFSSHMERMAPREGWRAVRCSDPVVEQMLQSLLPDGAKKSGKSSRRSK